MSSDHTIKDVLNLLNISFGEDETINFKKFSDRFVCDRCDKDDKEDDKEINKMEDGFYHYLNIDLCEDCYQILKENQDFNFVTDYPNVSSHLNPCNYRNYSLFEEDEDKHRYCSGFRFFNVLDNKELCEHHLNRLKDSSTESDNEWAKKHRQLTKDDFEYIQPSDYFQSGKYTFIPVSEKWVDENDIIIPCEVLSLPNFREVLDPEFLKTIYNGLTCATKGGYKEICSDEFFGVIGTLDKYWNIRSWLPFIRYRYNSEESEEDIDECYEEGVVLLGVDPKTNAGHIATAIGDDNCWWGINVHRDINLNDVLEQTKEKGVQKLVESLRIKDECGFNYD